MIAKTAFRYSADIPVMKVRQARSGRLTMAEPMRFKSMAMQLGMSSVSQLAWSPSP